MEKRPDVGSFFHDDNWFNFTVPGVNDDAKFGTGFDPQNNGVNPHHIHFGDFCLNVFDCPEPIPIPGGDVTNRRLIIQDDTWIFDFATGSVGDCELPGNNTGSYTLTEFVIVGDTIETTGDPGNAQLTIQNGPLTSTWSTIGNVPGGSGEVMVDGVDSQWIQTSNMRVGWLGDGTLTMQNGADVSNTWTNIGEQAEGVGRAIVTGAGTTWTNRESLVVGYLGNGTLSVGDGAAVSNTWTNIGSQANSVGVAIVTGNGTTWTHSDVLAVGLAGNGTLSVLEGAVVRNTWSVIGNVSGGSGEVMVDGVDSKWIQSANMFVGNLGHGTLTVQNSGHVENTWTNIGEQAEGVGTAIVTGSGTTWTNREGLGVGNFGDGTLTIQNGGHVENTFTNIGFQPDGVGTAIVTGGGTTWTHSDRLIVGVFGNGTLTIQDGGEVSNTFTNIARWADSMGTAIVTGAGTTWTLSQSLVVGFLDDGTLSVSDGAVVSNTWSSIGRELGGSGDVMVDGIASQWIQSADMRVGNFGDGTLTIQNGGHVENTFANIGFQPEGVGTAIVTGDGTTWTQSGAFVVGRFGNGTLSVRDGAVVSNTWARIGWIIDGVGNATIAGPGAQWLCDNFLIVGAQGEGHLTVSGGARLDTRESRRNTGGAVIGEVATGVGEITVTGGDSRWTCTHQMTVGRSGRGTLTVSDGASVRIAMLAPNSNPAALLVSRDTGSVGDVEVTGVGSEITMDNHLRVGAQVNTVGTVTISAGAGVNLIGSGGSAGLGLIGFAVGSDGALTVTGSGSTYTSVAQMQAGREGVGSLTIADGGHIVTAKAGSPTNSSGIAGTLAGSTGTVRVTGADSLWEQDGGMSVGFSGFGNLTVEAGGAIDSVDGYVARLEGSGGVANITGTDSVWEVSDSLYVGGNEVAEGGPAGLTVANGGALVIGDTLRLWNSGTLTLVGGSVTVGTGPVETTLDLMRLHEDGTLTGIGGALGNVISNGTIAPGASAGVLSIDGDYTQDVAGVLEMEIGGVGPGTDFDRLEVTGQAALNGTLRIILIRNFEPTLGDRFEIMTYASHTGDFSELIGVDLGDGLALDLVSGPVGLTLVVIEDCNENGIDDAVDIEEGTSEDCNDNGRPDECEIPRERGEGFFCDVDCDPDCNENGVPDACDIADGTSEDCNGNGIPDSCELEACDGAPACSDCNGNGILDECDIAACEDDPDCGDCNNNGVPDRCDIEEGNSEDVDEDGVPDECIEWDDGGGDEFWSTPENWEDDDVPGDEAPEDVESVVIEVIGEQAANVVLDIDASIDSLVLGSGASLDIATGDLAIDAAGGINNSGDLTVRDGRAIRATAAMPIAGVEPIVLTGDTASISSSLAEDVVTNLGTVNGRGRIAAALLNRGIIRADDPEGALVIADETFPKINEGILRADAGGRLRIETDISGSGDLATDGGVISIPSGTGAVTVEGGTLTIDDVDFLGGAGLEVDRDTSVLLSGDMRIIRGRYGAAPGAEDVSAFLSARSVTIQGGVRGGEPGEMELMGDMRVDVAEDLLLDGAGTGPCGSGFRGNDTPPILRSAGFARIRVGNDIRFVESVEVRIGEQAVMSLGGDFDNRSIWAMCFDWPGRLELNGIELQQFEVAGNDVGVAPAGFDENFAMSALELAPNATVRLLDDFDNQQNGGDACDEALYVNTLIVGEGATIEENSCTVYYRTLDDRGGNLPGLGTRIVKLADGDFDEDGDADQDDYAAFHDCMAGPNQSPPGDADRVARCLVHFDADDDLDIDIEDYLNFQVQRSREP